MTYTKKIPPTNTTGHRGPWILLRGGKLAEAGKQPEKKAVGNREHVIDANGLEMVNQRCKGGRIEKRARRGQPGKEDLWASKGNCAEEDWGEKGRREGGGRENGTNPGDTALICKWGPLSPLEKKCRR